MGFPKVFLWFIDKSALSVKRTPTKTKMPWDCHQLFAPTQCLGFHHGAPRELYGFIKHGGLVNPQKKWRFLTRKNMEKAIQ